MTYSVKHLPCKHKDLILSPWTQAAVMVHAYNPSAQEGARDGAHWPASLA